MKSIKYLWLVVLVFVLVNVLFVTFVAISFDTSTGLEPTKDQVEISSSDKKPLRARAFWERSAAIKFSLDQMAVTIKYMFAAAAAFLAFIIKIIIEPFQKKQDEVILPPSSSILLIVR